jgi:hypothetical protein
MANVNLENRVAQLEEIVAQLQAKVGKDEKPWWQQIRGSFANDADFDEAMKLGREYRESLRPKDDSEENLNGNS